MGSILSPACWYSHRLVAVITRWRRWECFTEPHDSHPTRWRGIPLHQSFPELRAGSMVRSSSAPPVG